MLRGVRPPRPSGTPPEGGELCRGRDFAWGKSGGSGGGPGLKREPERAWEIGLSGQQRPSPNSSVPNNRFPWKNRATQARTIHMLYRAARNPLLQEGAGGGPERDCRTASQSPAKRRPPRGGPAQDCRVKRKSPAKPAKSPPENLLFRPD